MTMTVERAAYALARGVDYFGGALFLGGLAFLALLWPEGGESRGGRRVVVTGWLLGLIGTVTASRRGDHARGARATFDPMLIVAELVAAVTIICLLLMGARPER